MLLLIDNYDSFTYNLLHYIGELGEDIAVHRNDMITSEEALNLNINGIVISPGPCDPDRAGICLDLVQKAARISIPVLGVCLGHQVIGQAFGGRIVRSPVAMHGKLSSINHNGEGLFDQLPDPFLATRYHSLTIDPPSLPVCFEILATTDDGVIQGIKHRNLPVHGVQFHPESIASECGHRLLKNFLSICKGRK
ncbi:MAG: aminodeoxychorismate/anthranilate synthase component II [Magnetovibrio sp.]|nr:aminodeoxychorismate/anthranilate synthase component II [Magnetovibrio sp.]